jgi:ABC-type glycerol-3-phosphate transport system substrate-binding protein
MKLPLMKFISLVAVLLLAGALAACSSHPSSRPRHGAASTSTSTTYTVIEPPPPPLPGHGGT